MTSMPSAASTETLSAPDRTTDQGASRLAAALRRTWHALLPKHWLATRFTDPTLADAQNVVDLESRMRTYQRRSGL